MYYTVFYCLILLVLLMIAIINKKGPLYKMQLFYFLFIGIMSVIAIHMDIVVHQNIRLWPYIYLIVCYMVSLKPLEVFHSTHSELNILMNFKYLKCFAVIFIIFSIISCVVFFPQVSTLLESQDWMGNRNFMNENDVIVTHNVSEWIAINFSTYFRLPAAIIFYLFVTFDKYKWTRKVLIFSIVISTFMTAIYGSSRGILLNLFLLLIAMFFVFSNWMDKKEKKRLLYFFAVIGTIGLTYAISVTISRFSEYTSFGSNGTLGSLIFYYGHSPVIFNNNITEATNPMYGKYAFGTLLSMFGIKDTFSVALTGTQWSSWFYTYVGCIYLDWGILISLFLIGLISLMNIKILSKKLLNLSSLYALFFYVSFLQRGALVIGRSFSFEFLVFLLIYFMLFFVEHIKNSPFASKIYNKVRNKNLSREDHTDL